MPPRLVNEINTNKGTKMFKKNYFYCVFFDKKNCTFAARKICLTKIN